MVSSVCEKRAAKWAKLEHDYMREDLQALEELDMPEHLKLERREELEQMIEDMKGEARLQIRQEEAVRRKKSIVIMLSTGTALLVSGLLAGGCWESGVTLLLCAASLFVRGHRRGSGSPKLPIRKPPY